MQTGLQAPDQIRSCRQVLVHILAHPDLLFCQHPLYHISLLRNHHVLNVCQNQPEFTKWLQRLKSLLQCRSTKSSVSDDTIELQSSDSSPNPNSVELGWWAASLYLAETVAACPSALIADFSDWLTTLSRLPATSGPCRIAVIQAFRSVCVAAADAADFRMDALVQHVAPWIAQVTSATPSDTSLALITLDALTQISASLHKAIRQHSSKMVAYALTFADHDEDDVRRAAARTLATVVASCSPTVSIIDYVSGLDRLLDRYMLRSLSNDSPNVDDAPFTTSLRFGPVPVASVLCRWRFLSDVIRAVLDDDTAAVSIPIGDVLRTLARVMHTQVPATMLGTITSHPISCLNLFTVLPALQAEIIHILSSLCRRLQRRLLPFSVIIGDMLSAVPLQHVLGAMPAAIGAVGASILEPVIIPSVKAACDIIRHACIVPAATIIDSAIQRGKKRTTTPTLSKAGGPRTPSSPHLLDSIAPYLDLITATLQHVGDRLSHDILQTITGVLNTALTSPCLIRDRRRLFVCFRELVSARYRQTPDLALLRQAGRIFASGRFGRDADVCCQGLALVQHLATPAVPVAVHQRVLAESILTIDMDCTPSLEQTPSTVAADQPATASTTSVLSDQGAVSSSPAEACVIDENPAPVANSTALDSNPESGFASEMRMEVVPEPQPRLSASSPIVTVAEQRIQSSTAPLKLSRVPVSEGERNDEQRLVGVKRKEPEPIVRTSSASSDVAQLIDIGPDEADDQTPLWCF